MTMLIKMLAAAAAVGVAPSAADVIAGRECGGGSAATQDYMLVTKVTLVEPTL